MEVNTISVSSTVSNKKFCKNECSILSSSKNLLVCGIEMLPVELKENIFQNLELEDLFSISLVNRAFNSIIKDVLPLFHCVLIKRTKPKQLLKYTSTPIDLKDDDDCSFLSEQSRINSSSDKLNIKNRTRNVILEYEIPNQHVFFEKTNVKYLKLLYKNDNLFKLLKYLQKSATINLITLEVFEIFLNLKKKINFLNFLKEHQLHVTAFIDFNLLDGKPHIEYMKRYQESIKYISPIFENLLIKNTFKDLKEFSLFFDPYHFEHYFKILIDIVIPNLMKMSIESIYIKQKGRPSHFCNFKNQLRNKINSLFNADPNFETKLQMLCITCVGSGIRETIKFRPEFDHYTLFLNNGVDTIKKEKRYFWPLYLREIQNFE
ncbi:hypothetical protein HDU92_005244 [Lobulomyces angularis]|nr:hypothetical protein HDU92_005244 [Lobulomyces angularis]